MVRQSLSTSAVVSDSCPRLMLITQSRTSSLWDQGSDLARPPGSLLEGPVGVAAVAEVLLAQAAMTSVAVIGRVASAGMTGGGVAPRVAVEVRLEGMVQMMTTQRTGRMMAGAINHQACRTVEVRERLAAKGRPAAVSLPTFLIVSLVLRNARMRSLSEETRETRTRS